MLGFLLLFELLFPTASLLHSKKVSLGIRGFRLRGVRVRYGELRRGDRLPAYISLSADFNTEANNQKKKYKCHRNRQIVCYSPQKPY